MILFKFIVDQEFMETYVPELMKMKALQLADGADMQNMNNYLLENYNIKVKDIVNQVYEHYEMNSVADTLILRINSNLVERRSQENLSALVRLVEYGNRDVAGTKLLARLKEYIHDNIKEIYSVYLYNNQENDEE